MEKDNTDKNKEISKVAQKEEKVLDFWNASDIFKKSVERDAPSGDFLFYDGPPFATGMPHYGHIFVGTVKDVLPRYKTMTGHKVVRRWGWDCHGLPIENLVQKENDLNSKEDIEKFGIKKFAESARDSVFRYDKEWKKIVPRTGRFVDMDDKYTTMDASYTESIWWMFKTLHEKGLAYEGFKSMHVCPKCETPLSNFEVNQGYKMIKDISVTAQFKVIGEENLYILAWTTTPWTLPGNAALAVGSDIDYVKVKHEENLYIVAKELLEKVFEGKEYEVIEEATGEKLVGLQYEPVFDFYKNADLEGIENAWKVYAADFVTTEDGTGIVHIAPGFGDDDYNLGIDNAIPVISHVNMNGTWKEDLGEFSGHHVKPKDKHSSGDIMIIKALAANGELFSKLKYEHSYPHCWRCESPLINYATASWYIKVTEMRDKLVEENNKINWVPESVGKNRFGNWLEDARDWSISRSRFWGAPIPVWKSEDGEEIDILGSVDDIKEKTKGTNAYHSMRHGESKYNVDGLVSCDITNDDPLTEKGIEQVKESASNIANKKIDIIFSSDLRRAQETAEIVQESLGLPEDIIVIDQRLREVFVPSFNGHPWSDHAKEFPRVTGEQFRKAREGEETYYDMKKRVGEFLYEIDKKYEGKNILIVSHGVTLTSMQSIVKGDDMEQAIVTHSEFIRTCKNAQVDKVDFAPLPHNDNYELDFHRPYIDEVVYQKNGKEMRRIEDIFDTWIDSGSMPFASRHYPFNTEETNPPEGIQFPADFIAEALDQTRGWFYTMLVLNVALFGKSPYKNVVVSGLVLAEDGRKMSKSLQNYPPVSHVLNSYGADAMRYYMISAPLVRAEDLNFTEKGVDEVMKKLVMRLENVVAFYEMYGGEGVEEGGGVPQSASVLDQWILARLFETRNTITESMEVYQLDKASRPLLDLIDDLSTWYVRRSRDRFKTENDDTQDALQTIRYVLLELSKLMAPFTPFIAEDVFQRVSGSEYQSEDQSVHLEQWPVEQEIEQKALIDMKNVRTIVTLALEARAKSGMKVRQPLQTLFISKTYKGILENELLVDVLKDELNVKSVELKETLEEGSDVELDLTLTPELKNEGAIRDLIRAIQACRKNTGLQPEDRITLTIQSSGDVQKIVESFRSDIESVAGVSEFVFADLNEEDESNQELKFLEETLVFSIEKK